MPPRNRAQLPGIIVARTCPARFIRWKLVPLLAGHLAGFAANTQARISEKSHRRLLWRRRHFTSNQPGHHITQRSPLSISRVSRRFNSHESSLLQLRHPPWTYITGKRLGLFNAHIWLQNHVREIVGDTTCALSLESPVERQANLVYHAPAKVKRAHTPRNHRPCFNLPARRADNHPIPMPDLALSRQFWTDFSEQRRLQCVQPRHPARHRPTDMVFGQAISRNHNRVIRITYRREAVIWSIAEILRRRIALLVVQRILHRRLSRFV